MMRRFRFIFALFAVMLGVVPFNGRVTQTNTAQAPPVSLPVLIEASVDPRTPGAVSVTGHDFTPGGEVYVAFHDPWGAHLHEAFWIRASGTVHGPNGSMDPAIGFFLGGGIEEVFGAPAPLYGPNGSQDPASGFVPGDVIAETFRSLCDAPVMVRAYDARTAVWSNAFDINPRCQS